MFNNKYTSNVVAATSHMMIKQDAERFDDDMAIKIILPLPNPVM